MTTGDAAMTRDDATSEDVRNDYVFRTMDAMGGVWSSDHTAYTIQKMADEIVRLRRTLSSLRRPSEAIVEAVDHELQDTVGTWHTPYAIRCIVRAAVLAAESKVQP